MKCGMFVLFMLSFCRISVTKKCSCNKIYGRKVENVKVHVESMILIMQVVQRSIHIVCSLIHLYQLIDIFINMDLAQTDQIFVEIL